MAYVRKMDHERLPWKALRLVNWMGVKGLCNPGESIYHGGHMYDGRYYFPLAGNRVLFYDYLANGAYILTLKPPRELAMADMRLIHKLTDIPEIEKVTREFYKAFEKRDASPLREYPMPIKAYIPMLTIDSHDNLVIRTQPVNADNFRSSAKYRHETRPEPSMDDIIRREQVAFGNEYKNDR